MQQGIKFRVADCKVCRKTLYPITSRLEIKSPVLMHASIQEDRDPVIEKNLSESYLMSDQTGDIHTREDPILVEGRKL